MTTVNIDDLISLFTDINKELNNIFLDNTRISTNEYNNRIEKLFNNNINKKHIKLDVKISSCTLSNIVNLLISFKPISFS